MSPPIAMNPAPHVAADFVSRFAIDKNHSAAHSGSAAAITATDEMPRIAAHANRPATHLRSDPIARVAFHFNRAATHLGTAVHPDVVVDRQTARRHVGPNPFHPRAIAVQHNLLIAGIPFDSKKLTKRCRSISVLNWQSGNFSDRLTRQKIGRDALRLDGDRGCSDVGESKHRIRQSLDGKMLEECKGAHHQAQPFSVYEPSRLIRIFRYDASDGGPP